MLTQFAEFPVTIVFRWFELLVISKPSRPRMGVSASRYYTSKRRRLFKITRLAPFHLEHPIIMPRPPWKPCISSPPDFRLVEQTLKGTLHLKFYMRLYSVVIRPEFFFHIELLAILRDSNRENFYYGH